MRSLESLFLTYHFDPQSHKSMAIVRCICPNSLFVFKEYRNQPCDLSSRCAWCDGVVMNRGDKPAGDSSMPDDSFRVGAVISALVLSFAIGCGGQGTRGGDGLDAVAFEIRRSPVGSDFLDRRPAAHGGSSISGVVSSASGNRILT